MKKQQTVEEKRSEFAYKIKNKKYGSIYVSFTGHGKERLNERNIDILSFLFTLTQTSDELVECADSGDSLVVDTQKNMSIILSVSKTETKKGETLYYFNIITVLSDIPMNESGELKFYKIKHFIYH